MPEILAPLPFVRGTPPEKPQSYRDIIDKCRTAVHRADEGETVDHNEHLVGFFDTLITSHDPIPKDKWLPCTTDTEIYFSQDAIEIRKRDYTYVNRVPWSLIESQYTSLSCDLPMPSDLRAVLIPLLGAAKRKILGSESPALDMSGESPDLISCLGEIKNLTERYDADLALFYNTKRLHDAPEREIKTTINSLRGIHRDVVAQMKTLIKTHHGKLDDYLTRMKSNLSHTGQKSAGFICPFITLSQEDGELTFNAMTETELSETFWGIADGIRDDADGIGDRAWRIMKFGAGFLPVTAEIQDASNAWQEFNRGHMKNGCIHLVFFGIDLLIDVGEVVAGTVVPVAGGVAVNAGRIGIKALMRRWMEAAAKKALHGVKAEKIAKFVRGAEYVRLMKQRANFLLKGYKKSVQPLKLTESALSEGVMNLPRSDKIKVKDIP